jgi:hypothetical protein
MDRPAEQFWKMVAGDLGVRVDLSPGIVFSDGTHLTVDALVTDFGASRGMLVVRDHDVIKPFAKLAVADGYGYSSNIGGDAYDRDAMIEVLRDWGWIGPSELKPDWLC